jgi:hypothetical protein
MDLDPSIPPRSLPDSARRSWARAATRLRRLATMRGEHSVSPTTTASTSDAHQGPHSHDAVERGHIQEAASVISARRIEGLPCHPPLSGDADPMPRTQHLGEAIRYRSTGPSNRGAAERWRLSSL